MANDNRSGLSEAVEKGANTAHAIRGAIKTGKAIAAASKGAAVGGPFGAAAGVLWANKKLFGKIVAAVVALLLLPLLFILMLPGLLFGGLTEETNGSGLPVLNDDNVITENVNEISFTINSVLADGLDGIITRIHEDFAKSSGQQLEIINPYEGDPIHNGNIFVSQYCASKNQDYASISLSDMERVLKDGKNHLYSFRRTEEHRPAVYTDPVTGEEYTFDELWMIYTIVYNGESHFSDEVFHLSDDQKALADDYAYNMSLFLDDGIYQGLLPDEFVTGSYYSGIRFTDGLTSVVYYNQLDKEYAGKPYGTDHIGGYGCGPTAMAIVVSSLSDDMVNPVQMARWSYENGYWCKKSGSYHALIPNAAKAWELLVEGCKASEPQRIIDALSQGKLVVAIMKKGHFTSSGHFIVLRGVTADGKILVADPASRKRSEKEWDLSIILNEASKRAAAGGPFWLIG